MAVEPRTSSRCRHVTDSDQPFLSSIAALKRARSQERLGATRVEEQGFSPRAVIIRFGSTVSRLVRSATTTRTAARLGHRCMHLAGPVQQDIDAATLPEAPIPVAAAVAGRYANASRAR